MLMLGLCLTASAEPFEWWGYRQGMSAANVQEVAKRNLHEFKWMDDEKINASLLARGRGLVGLLSFCKGRLYRVGYDVDGGLRKFVKVLVGLEHDGFRKVDTGWDDRLSGPYEFWSVSLFFTKPGSEGDYYVEAKLNGFEQRDIANTAVSYESRLGFCDQ
jgi:hypothetical protein